MPGSCYSFLSAFLQAIIKVQMVNHDLPAGDTPNIRFWRYKTLPDGDPLFV